ncbi:signal peptidase I [Streptomyces xanthophaeus]
MAHRPGRRLGTWAVAVLVLGIALIGGPVAFMLSRFTAARVSSENMLPTVTPGDLVVFRKDPSTVRRGDVVLYDPGDWGLRGPFLGRVVAVGGDRISYAEGAGTLILNGRLLNEPYVQGGAPGAGGVDFDVTVPRGRIFLLGDNRGDSADSRFHAESEHGTLPESAVTGIQFGDDHPVALGLGASMSAGVCLLPVALGLGIAWRVVRRRHVHGPQPVPVHPVWGAARSE